MYVLKMPAPAPADLTFDTADALDAVALLLEGALADLERAGDLLQGLRLAEDLPPGDRMACDVQGQRLATLVKALERMQGPREMGPLLALGKAAHALAGAEYGTPARG